MTDETVPEYRDGVVSERMEERAVEGRAVLLERREREEEEAPPTEGS